MKKKLHLLTCLLLASSILKAQMGNLDPTFGFNGVEKTEFIEKGTLVSEKGDSYGIEGSNGFDSPVRVYKYISNGSLDLAYGNSGYTDPVTMRYYTSEIENDGKIIVVGTVGYFSQIRVVRFNVDGSIDFISTKSSSPPNSTVSQIPAKIIKMENGFAVLGYAASTSAPNIGNWDFINRYNSSGLISSQIISIRHTPPPPPYTYSYFSINKSVLIQGDNLVVAGPEMIETPSSQTTIGNYVTTSPNGVRVPATMPLGYYEHMILDASGKLVVVNSIKDATSGNNDFRVSRFNTDGSPDLTFNGSGAQITDFGADDSAYAVVFEGDKIIVAGSTRDIISGETAFAIARYNADGTLDLTFSEDGKQTLGEDGYAYTLEQIKIKENRLLALGTARSNTGKTYRIVAAYLLSATENNILLNCPPAKIVATDNGICGALVNNIDPIITPSQGSSAVSYTLSTAAFGTVTGSASGTTFNKGETIVTYKLVSDATKTCSFKVTVEDKEAPVISNVSVSPNSIWPPNHEMVNVNVLYDVYDNCGITNAVLSITSNEPESGTENDDVAGDWKIIDPHHVQLRAERLGRGNGRVYTITITAADADGNKTTKQVNITVPHDKAIVKGKNTSEKLSIKLFSNPTKDFFTLSLQTKSSESASLRVIDNFGRMVEARTGILTNGTLQIGSGYHPGTYFAEVKQGDQKETVTMIKF